MRTISIHKFYLISIGILQEPLCDAEEKFSWLPVDLNMKQEAAGWETVRCCNAFAAVSVRLFGTFERAQD